MSKHAVIVKTKIYTPKIKYIDTTFNVPKAAHDYFAEKKYKLEMICHSSESHSLYVVAESGDDVVSKTFNPNFDNMKWVMKTIFSKLAVLDKEIKKELKK